MFERDFIMKIVIELPDYDGNGIDVIWDENSKCRITVYDGEVGLSANREGLIAIAKQMLYMAYNDLPEGSHIHYDSFFTKQEGKELLIEKVD